MFGLHNSHMHMYILYILVTWYIFRNKPKRNGNSFTPHSENSRNPTEQCGQLHVNTSLVRHDRISCLIWKNGWEGLFWKQRCEALLWSASSRAGIWGKCPQDCRATICSSTFLLNQSFLYQNKLNKHSENIYLICLTCECTCTLILNRIERYLSDS